MTESDIDVQTNRPDRDRVELDLRNCASWATLPNPDITAHRLAAEVLALRDDLAAARAELRHRANLCQLYAQHISAVRVALDVTEDADCSGPDSADVRVIERLRHDLDAVRRTVADYVAHVEDGARFEALVSLAKGMT